MNQTVDGIIPLQEIDQTKNVRLKLVDAVITLEHCVVAYVAHVMGPQAVMETPHRFRRTGDLLEEHLTIWFDLPTTFRAMRLRNLALHPDSGESQSAGSNRDYERSSRRVIQMLAKFRAHCRQRCPELGLHTALGPTPSNFVHQQSTKPDDLGSILGNISTAIMFGGFGVALLIIFGKIFVEMFAEIYRL